ncbi:MAG: hypothetical protein LBT47_09680 [Deltaproteobacteria bacterium]|jgi:hypothetical protein|nr:hypothetical protein [Deltaproteobacteria bacterium]
MSKTITVKAAKDALNNLRKMTPANEKYDDDLEMSIKETVFFMAPGLTQLARRGFTIKELATGLAKDGIQIKSGTINRYLNEYLAAKQNPEKPKGASPAGKSDDGKSAAAAKSESNDSKDSGVQTAAVQAAKNETSKPES